MKFYEIVLGKMTASDQPDDNLNLMTHLGLAESALQLGLKDQLVHFSTQGLKLRIDNSSIKTQLLHKRAKGYQSQNKYEKARVDFEKVLDMVTD